MRTRRSIRNQERLWRALGGPPRAKWWIIVDNDGSPFAIAEADGDAWSAAAARAGYLGHPNEVYHRLQTEGFRCVSIPRPNPSEGAMP